MKWIPATIRLVFLGLFLLITSKGNMILWLAFFLVSLIITLVFGRVYCGYICPMNTVMIPTEWVSKKMKIQKADAPKWLKAGSFPWVFLGLSLVVMIFSKKVWQINIPLLLIWVAISILVSIRYKPYVFHNLICPFGTLQKTFGKASLFSKKVDQVSCIGCKKCEVVCPSLAIAVNLENKKASISRKLCHQCTNCTDVCPTSAIHYKKYESGEFCKR